MPKLTKRITDSLVRTLRGPETPAEITSRAVVHWCKDKPGFGVKVSLTGDRSFVSERRVNGKTVRRTLGKAPGGKAAGAISTDTARKLLLTVSSELQTGVDRLEVKREERKVEKKDGITLSIALAEYVKGKRRGKDGLALKDRTKADYMAMVSSGGTAKDGKPFLDGPLRPLADTPLTKITADEIRKVYADTLNRSQRTATYAMQVLRAVMNWQGVAIEDSPLSKGTAGKKRIVLAPTKGKPTPIPPERLGAWWSAATARAGNAAVDGCRMILLTGCRPGEIFGSQGTDEDDEHTVFAAGVLVQDVDMVGGRMVLPDTKNRKEHIVVLSTQAIEIVKAHCKDKNPGDKVFNAIYPSKAIAAINADAGVVGITPHKLRHTFASVAEELVSGYALKRMLNHTDAGDVTGNNYVGKSETQLRAAWQTVADFIAASPQIASS